MKRSTAVVLVLSGAILGGCDRNKTTMPQSSAGFADGSTNGHPSQVITNDTYIEGRGYYHSPFHAWFPYPYNFFAPGLGYYRGGHYFNAPDLVLPRPTYPGRFAYASQTRATGNDDDRNKSGGGGSGGMRESRTSGTPEYLNRGGFTRSRSWSSHSSSS